MMLSPSAGAPDDVVAATCPRRCCRIVGRAPDDVVVVAAVPQTMLSPSSRCPRRCCRRRRCPRRCCRIAIWCPTRCCRRRRRCPRRCCRCRRRAPHDVVASAACPRRCCRRRPRPCPRRCCRRRSIGAPDDVVAVERRAPDDVVAAADVPQTMLWPRSRVRDPNDAVFQALAFGLMTPPASRWLPQKICWLHAARADTPDQAGRSRRTWPGAPRRACSGSRRPASAGCSRCGPAPCTG